MEAFAGGVLDGAGVVLEVVDVLAEAFVFGFEALFLLLEGAGLFALVGKGGEAVVAEDDAVAHDERECGDGDGGHAASPQEDALLGHRGECRELQGLLRVG